MGIVVGIREQRGAWERSVLLRGVRQKVSDELQAAFGTAGRIEVPIVWSGGNRDGEPLPAATGLWEGYQQARDSLLVLGPPGSGKTTAVYELAAHLLTRAEEDPAQPVPVVVNLSSWAQHHGKLQHRGKLEPWLADELSAVYQVPDRLARAWVTDERILPLLDGLDEVAPAPARRACAEQVNAYRRRHGLVRLVLAGTAEAYQECAGTLRLHEVVELRPLDRSRVLSQLGRAGLRLDPDQQADPAVLEPLATPLALDLVTATHRGDGSATVTLPAPGASIPAAGAVAASAEGRGGLLAEFVTRSLRDTAGGPSRPDAEPGYPPERALEWLARLAAAMRERGDSEFRLDLLQPDWLTGRAGPRLALLAPQAVTVAVAFGLAFALYAPLAGALPALGLTLAALAVNALIASQLRPPGRYAITPVEQCDWHPAPTWLHRLGPAHAAAALTTADPDARPGPADGIARSARQAAVAGGWTLLLVLPPLVLLLAAERTGPLGIRLAATVPLVLVVVVLPVAMRYGGQACCRHLAVRALLVREGRAPWRFGRLLTDAAAGGLLVRTGSGYRFRHRLVLDHLAAQATTRPGRVEARSPEQTTTPV